MATTHATDAPIFQETSGVQRTAPLLVRDTKCIPWPRPHAKPYFEVTLAPDDRPDARVLVLVTRDRDLYEHAAFLEDSPRRVVATWTRGRRTDGKHANLLRTLDEVPS